MTRDHLNDCYLLKFCLNLHKKYRRIPSGAELDSEFLQDQSAPITKKNLLSMACQFYDPTGLAAQLMFSIRSMSSEICRDRQCSINSILSEERTNRFCSAVNKILITRTMSFPCQIIFNYSTSSSSSSMLACRAMVPSYMSALTVNSTFSPAHPRFWENLLSLCPSLRSLELFWPPEWNRRLARSCTMFLSPLLCS